MLWLKINENFIILSVRKTKVNYLNGIFLLFLNHIVAEITKLD